MAEQAATAAADGYRLLKIKLTGEGDRLRQVWISGWETGQTAG